MRSCSLSQTGREGASQSPADLAEITVEEQLKERYFFRCGETPVRVCFAPDGPELGQKLKFHFLSRGR